MSKKTIVLADNSYTIRRIVELSFSDETDIELITFENGLNLRQKLLELRPQIVLVDIKLPEFNGYDLCYFVQTTDSLKKTKVFLLKGGFEPIDEGLLHGLKYEDIITKPFDSNALVSNIKKLLESMQEEPVSSPMEAEIPSSFPEDEEELPDINELPDDDKDISFSDVKEEIESAEEILPEEIPLARTPISFSDEEILPSEEITRAQPDKDTISPAFDDDDNPFMEEMSNDSGPDFSRDEETDHITEEELSIKRNIQMQEKELEIDSLTLEEINIKRDIERKERERSRDYQEQGLQSDMVIDDEAEEVDADTSDMFPDAKLEPQEDLFTYAKQKTGMEPPNYDSDLDYLSEKAPEEPELPDIKYEQDIEDDMMEIPAPNFSSQEEELPSPDELEFESEPEAPEIDNQYEIPDFDSPGQPSAPVADFDEDIPGLDLTPEPPTAEEPEELEQLDEFDDEVSEVEEEEEPAIPEEFELRTPPTPQPPPPPPEPPIVKKVEQELPDTSEIPTPPKPTPPPPPQPKPTHEVQKISADEIITRIEDKLTIAIKEMLWEVLPPLAEKIITEEIEALKEEAERSLK